MEKSLRVEADSTYCKLNYHWLKFHFYTLLLCVLISTAFEILMYFFIRFTGTMYDSNGMYWLKYIMIPTGIGVLISAIGYHVLHMKTLRTTIKIYSISFLFLLAAFNLAFIHSGYLAILFCFLFPILMSVVYEDQRLTRCIALSTIPLECLSAFSTFWDPYKEITHGYCVNTIILIILTMFVWLVSYFMIRFSLLKKEVIIQRDMERQQLKERILLDALTAVGNKQALFNRLKQLEDACDTFHLAMLDLDGFKHINDENGHLFGDEVLICLGTALHKMRGECFAYRYGGDEFCIILMEHQKQKVVRNLEYLQSDFMQCLKESKHAIDMHITVSIGVAIYHENMRCVELLKSADEALYQSKHCAKGSITYRE